MVAKTAQLVRRHVPLWTMGVVLGGLLIYLIPGLASHLVYDRHAILAGEWWRIITGNWVHFSASHLGYDLLVLGIAGWIIERSGYPSFSLFLISSALGIGVALLVAQPEMRFYGGLSGIACGTMVYLCLHGLRERGAWRWLCVAALLLTTGKIVLEFVTGTPVLARADDRPFIPVPLSHVTGALTALVVWRISNIPKHVRRLRPVLLKAVTVVVLSLALQACQGIPGPPPPNKSAGPLWPEINRYVEARRHSLALRADLDDLSKLVRHESAKDGQRPAESLERLLADKRQYFALREALFETVFLHASAIVENAQGRDAHNQLVHTSLALMAGTDLVNNFHVAAAVLSASEVLMSAWNEADPGHGIPERSWDISLEASRNARYRDLFKAAIEKLDTHRNEMDRYRQRGDPNVLALYEEGIEAALRRAEQSYALVVAGFAAEDIGRDEQELRALVERSKTLRGAWATSAPALRQAIAHDGGLIRGNVHVQVFAAKRQYLDLREALYRLTFKHVAKLTREDIPFPQEFRLRAIGISVLAAVTLYENARFIETQVLSLPGVKPLLNQGDPAQGIPPRFWDEIEREYARIEFRNLLKSGMEAVNRAQALSNQTGTQEDPLLTYVGQELAVSAAAGAIRGEGALAKIGRALRHSLGQIEAMGVGLLGEGPIQFSKGFGNLVGMIEFRKGKLFSQPEWVRFVKERLEPGDLLLEKTPFRLTDTFIPGHFGHVAMYVGNDAQLRALGLLTHPLVSPHAARIAEGKTIVEALRTGTHLHAIEEFLNIDDLVILRPKPGRIPPADVAQAIALAFSHIGKKYDFGFDTNTWDTIVCSELAFQTYVNVRWPFGKALTAYTIAPDDVAIMAGADPVRPFELFTFIHDGQVVHDRAKGLLHEERYVELLGRHYADAVR